MTAVEKWVNGYKITYFPWIDGKLIYFNVQYYKPGSSLSQPPALEETLLVMDNDEFRGLLQDNEDSLLAFIVQKVLRRKREETGAKHDR